MRDVGSSIGVMGFSQSTGSIDFLAAHPQYRHLGITKLFLDDHLPYIGIGLNGGMNLQ